MPAPDAPDLLLGVDCGTSLVKAALYARDGSCLGAGEAPQRTTTPQPGWSEQDPQDWWRSLRRAVRAALAAAAVPGERVAALGLSTQGGTIAVFDAKGLARGPALVWNDLRQRAPEEDTAQVREEHFALTGVPHRHMSPGAITWLQRHRPGWLVGEYRFGYVPDYLSFRLTGEWITDPTNLAISNLCDLASGDVGQATRARLGLPPTSLPAARPAGTPAGRLLPRAARALGLGADVVVAVAAHDQYAASLGAGCTEPGDLLLSAGTAWVLLLTTDHRVTDQASSCYPSRHVEPGRWGVLASIATGNTTLDRVLSLTGQRRDWPRLSAAVEAVPPGSDGVLVLPHLVGRSAPTWDEDARGAVLGLSTGHTRAHVWRAAMEGLAFDAKRVCEYLAGHGAGLHSLRMVGGAARSTVWPSIVASVLGVPVMTCAGENLAVRGAACLGARAAGRPDLPLATDWHTHRPRADWEEAYARTYVRYVEAVRKLERAT